MEGFRGQVMRLTYWKAAKTTFSRQFEEAMSEMRSLSEFAEAWLRDKDPRTWLRAHFSTRCKSNLLLNNNSECFNKKMRLVRNPIRPLGRPKQTRRKEVDEVRKSGPKLSKIDNKLTVPNVANQAIIQGLAKGLLGVTKWQANHRAYKF
ncbi:hypothetical protein J1N35_002513 [Gossypium stocksii]|uniref:Uncharacterized protein n=1 Tax=Gossypium stocksii TaxID=47602 RepID=A0A9D3WM35_9ROSI|nr:hypothetical protein J1N35_002513 [Gossypium stocksii]